MSVANNFFASASLFACPIPQLPLLGIQPQTDQLSQPGRAFGFGNAGWTEKEIAQVQGKADDDHQRQ